MKKLLLLGIVFIILFSLGVSATNYYDLNSYNITSESKSQSYIAGAGSFTGNTVIFNNTAIKDLIITSISFKMNAFGTRTVEIRDSTGSVIVSNTSYIDGGLTPTVYFELTDYPTYIRSGEDFTIYIHDDETNNELDTKPYGGSTGGYNNTDFIYCNDCVNDATRIPNSGSIGYKIISDQSLELQVNDSQGIETINNFTVTFDDGTFSETISSNSNTETSTFSNIPFVSRDMVSTWNLDKDDTTTIVDVISGNNGTLNGKTLNDGTITGATYNTHTGDMVQFGDYLEFDGVSDYVTITDINEIRDNQTFTVSMWVNKSDTTDGAIYYYGINNYNVFSINYHSSGEIRSGFYNGAIYVHSASGSITNAEKHYITYSHTSANGSLYIDGILQTGTNSISVGGYSNTYIGSRSGSANFFDGSIDEVKIWNRALSETEINEEMNSVGVANPEGIVAYYNFDEGSGTTALDKNYISTGINANVTAYNFDGVDDHVDISSVIGTDFTDQITFSSWVNINDLTASNNKIIDISDDIKSLSTADKLWCQIKNEALSNKFASYSNIGYSGWNLLTCTGDTNTGQVKLYLNGDLKNTGTGLDSITDRSLGSAIGSGYNGLSNFFNGSIALPKIYDRALNETEILDLYTRELNDERYPFSQGNVNINVTNAVGEQLRPYFNNETNSYTIIDSANSEIITVNPYTKVNASDFNDLTKLTSFNGSFNNVTYNSDVNGNLYLPLTQNEEVLITKTDYRNRSINVTKFSDTNTQLMSTIKEFIVKTVANGVNIITYITDSINNVENLAYNVTFSNIELFPTYADTINVTFDYEPQNTVYFADSQNLTINKSTLSYNLTVEQYKLYLTFTENVNGTFITVDTTQTLPEYIQTEFTNSTVEKDMLDFDEDVVNIGFGKDNVNYTNNIQQNYQFINDYLTNFYDDIYVMQNPDEDIFVETFLVNSPATNVYVNLYQYVPNGSAMLVSKKLSDSEGKVNFRVESSEQYYITYYKDGFAVVKTLDFIPKDTVYTDYTQPLILRLNKDFTTYSYGRLILKGNNYPVFYNKSDDFNVKVYSKLDETLFYSVNDGINQRFEKTTDEDNYDLYKYEKTISSTTDWGDTVKITIRDSNLETLHVFYYTYHEGEELIDVPTDVKSNKTFLTILFIGLIIVSGIVGFAFENEELPSNVFMIGLIMLMFISFSTFAIGGGLAVVYFIMQQYKKVVSNE